ncbi:hypothetical protein [Streptomyces sp. I05A-00742]|uniref:hypothetical protein n=1 Tax=Streptomyces sp. I05A-00742 TaxID=2732853 RepID=UPI001488061E|nr:hypothetical protein [Streptomyces sp. I05A-00742]
MCDRVPGFPRYELRVFYRSSVPGHPETYCVVTVSANGGSVTPDIPSVVRAAEAELRKLTPVGSVQVTRRMLESADVTTR